METFKFSPAKNLPKPKKLAVTINLEGKLAHDFNTFVERCQVHCKVNHAEVVRQMMEYALHHMDHDLPIEVGDVLDQGVEKESFSVSTQP